MNQNDERMPYWFNQEQLELLTRIVGNNIEKGIATLRSVNDEIGVASARRHSSGIREKLPMMFKEDNLIFLMLSSQECNNILAVDPPDDIRKIIADGL